MEFDILALIEDVESAKVTLFKQHCEHADDPEQAAVGLASQLLYQASLVLEAIYGSKERAREHVRMFAGIGQR